MITRSARVKAPWQTRIDTVELPDTPKAGWIGLRIEACGICGTDLTEAQSAKDWKPFGHEIAGVVETVGAEVHNVAVGDRVVLESSSYCGVCDLCRNGRVDLCNKGANFWSQPAMGFSERMHAPACAAVKYAGLTPDVASLAEPAGVSYDMVKVAGITLGDRVAIVGPGPIALMAIPMALRSGAAEVVCIGRSHSKRRMALAEELGARSVAVDGALDQQKELQRRFEHVLVTAPVQNVPAALELLTYGGVLTYIGIGIGDGTISFDANAFHYRKLQLRASFASPAVYYPHVLSLLQKGIVPGEKFISHRFSLSEIAESLRVCREMKDQAVKVVIKP